MAALGIAALVGPPVNRSPPSAAIRQRRFPPASCRYQTMDTLSALMFARLSSLPPLARRQRQRPAAALHPVGQPDRRRRPDAGLYLHVRSAPAAAARSRVALRMARRSCTPMCNTPGDLGSVFMAVLMFIACW
ncbi:hypothetical protein M8494_26620 [Serratia ureilytica]